MTDYFLHLGIFFSFIFVSNLLNPILLIPGDGGTRLDAKLNLSKTPHIFCFKDLDWFIAWVNIPLVILPLEVDCMVAILKLEYNATSHTTSNPDGVEIKWGQPGTLKGISTLDEFGFIVYYRDMIEDLADVGYQPGVNIQGLPFDWRKAGNELTDSINSMIQLIESLYEKTNNSVIIVSHSMGGFVVLQMLQQQTKLWKDKYIKCVVAVATPYYGAIKAIQATISGYDLDSRFIPAEKLKYALRTYPSTAWLFPNTKFWDNKDTLVFTPSKNYTYNDYKELYADLNFKQGYKMYLDTFSLLTLEPPGVEWHTLYGENLSTPYRLRYGKDFPNDQPNIDSVSGDGTVNVFSSTGSKYWINKQKEKLEFHAINKVEHVDLISNREVIEYVKKVANVL